jgi:thiol-disulfide isomerase/thioredoxin
MCPLCLISWLIVAIVVIIAAIRKEMFYPSMALATAQTDLANVPIDSYFKVFPKEWYGQNGLVIVYHYTKWCQYCARMRPVWDTIKAELSGPSYSGITFIENDEDENPNQFVTSYPTIIKYYKGKSKIYEGPALRDPLKRFILSPQMVTTYGHTGTPLMANSQQDIYIP